MSVEVRCKIRAEKRQKIGNIIFKINFWTTLKRDGQKLEPYSRSILPNVNKNGAEMHSTQSDD